MITMEQLAINDLNYHIGLLVADFYKRCPNLILKEVITTFEEFKTFGTSLEYSENKTFPELIFKEEQP